VQVVGVVEGVLVVQVMLVVMGEHQVAEAEAVEVVLLLVEPVARVQEVK
jgi:hypothetical protein